MKIETAFTPGPADPTGVAVVIDVLRATTTITCALNTGYQRVLACGELDQARELAGRIGDGSVLAGERKCVRPEGFDLGNSPRELTSPPMGESLVLTTTNGTRAIVAADAHTETILIGCLMNLRACAHRAASIARESGAAVLVQCAGVRGAFTLDDAFTAGRYVAELAARLPEWELTDGSTAAVRLAETFESSVAGLAASQSARNLVAADLEADIAYCASESVLDLVPHVEKVDNGIALITV